MMAHYHEYGVFVQLAQALADTAGDVLRQHFRTSLPVEYKSDTSPVTAADRECEAAMRALIAKSFPEHGIFGEEYGRTYNDACYQWVLDPIDGTRSFIAGYPIFCTLISLIKNGIPILGVIDQPITRERWVGITGEITISPPGKKASTETGILATTSIDYFTSEERQALERLKKICVHTILGGDAYAYAMLASGHIDVVIDTALKPYDFCALAPVITGTGGVITDWQGLPLTLSSSGHVLAARNSSLHTAALTAISCR